MNLNLNGMVSMWKMRELVDKATNIVMNYTETEAKVLKTFRKRKYSGSNILRVILMMKKKPFDTNGRTDFFTSCHLFGAK